MTPRNRSHDLTAELLHDLEREEATPVPAPPPIPAKPAKPAKPARSARPEPAPFVETSLYLSPRGWRRPRLSRAGRSLSFSAGPLRLRIGRRG